MKTINMSVDDIGHYIRHGVIAEGEPDPSHYMVVMVKHQGPVSATVLIGTKEEVQAACDALTADQRARGEVVIKKSVET